MLKRVGESRQPCRTPSVVLNQSEMLLLKRTALVALPQRFFDDSEEVGAYIVLLNNCHKAASQTMSKAFLKSMKTL